MVVLVALFVAAVALGQLVVRPADAVGSPSQSRLRLVEDVFPPRHLTVRDINRGGPTCLQGHTLVVPEGGGCTFIVPNGVHVVVFRRVPGSAAMMVTLTETGELTQTVDTGQPGPDPRDPLRLRLATAHDPTTVTLFSCRGPGSCRLEVSG
jgi:hypothetical protein